MILHLHHRYRTLGGEERAIAGLRALTEQRLGEPTALLERDSATIGGRQAAAGLVRGGLDPDEVAAAVRRTGARIVHAHNVHPTFGFRALRAAREAGARVVLQLHNYRLVCAVGTCVRDGHDCTLCHGRDTRPGLRHRCRGGLAEGAAYGVGLARQQHPLLDACDVVVVPSQAALERLRQLGAPLPAGRVHVVPHPVDGGATADGGAGGGKWAVDRADDVWTRGRGTDGGRPDGGPGDRRPVGEATAPSGGRAGEGAAVVVGRLAPEKGTATAIEAARITGLPLVIANDGPLEQELRAVAADLPQVRFAGRLDRPALDALRAAASVELVPSLAHETFGLAAAEAMLRGLPVVASDVGALRELVPRDARVPPGDAAALAAAWLRVVADPTAGERQRACAARLTAPETVAERLRAVYAAAVAAGP